MILLTGATGFLGMEVLVRLLEDTDHEVLCLVRAPDREGAEGRLAGVLDTLYRDPARFDGRVHALRGDLTGEIARPGGEIDLVCHCAASISFGLPLDEARRINVDGTRRMLDVARDAGARRFVHVSTAYVAGTRPGAFREDMLDEGQGFRNTYEQTKWEAERLIAERAGDFGTTAVARPSIVMGESDSGWTPAFNVLYWPLRAFARGLFEQVPAKPEGRVDVVPVDHVADGIAKLMETDATGTFNLVSGADAATVDQLSELACAHFDRPKPPYVRSGAFGDAAADEHGAVYLPYFDMDVVFDDARTRTVLGLRPPKLPEYFDALMDYADLAKWGKRGLSREEARERGALAPS
ncbi:MAG TPA: SDR family oxidoreductase [Solirubrobacteraceae bacterium]|nr:SDR family oxidoreductase [Solirubrobacteraceae bacterium]